MRSAIIIAIVLLGFAHAANSSLEKIASSSSGLTLRLQSSELEIEESLFRGGKYHKLSLEGASSSAFEGAPDLPLYSTSVIMPPTGSYTLEVRRKAETSYYDILPYPVQSKDSAPEADYDNRAYSTYTEQAQVLTSEVSIFRDFRVLRLAINPLAWNALSKELTHCTEMEIEISFTDSPGANEVSPYQTYSPAFRELYEANLVNFDDYRSLNLALDGGRILLIHWNNTNSVFQDQLNGFITWKRQKGHELHAVSTQVTGTSNTAIKSYIQSRYDNPATRPDYIILVGDVGSIPTWIETLSGYGGEGDYPYTYLAGNDTMGDVMIGRISVETVEHLAIMLSKIYRYERNINIDPVAASWLNRILLIGDPSTSGISCVYASKYIKELAQTVNPEYSFIENYTGGFSSTINSGINQGVNFFTYRGWIGMSNWSPSSSLVNNPRFPHAVILTCGTGNFAGTATTESFTRLGTSANPAGAVTAIGMATSGTHTMFNNNLMAAIFNGLFSYKMRSMGEALLNGRLYMHEVYGATHPNQANYFAHWCNLIGDPTMEVFVGIPEAITLDVPESLPLGSLIVDVGVSDSSANPIAGVCVTAYSPATDSILATAYSDAYGNVSLSIPGGISDNLTITASKNDHKPTQTVVEVAAGALVANGFTLYDNGMQGSFGNADGFAGAGETVAVILNVKNTSELSLSGLSGTVSSSDPHVSLGSNNISFGDLIPDAVEDADAAILITIDHTIPAIHDIRLQLSISDANGTIHEFPIHVPAYNANLQVEALNILAGGNGILDPAETGTLQIGIMNNAVVPAHGLMAELISLNDLVVVNQPTSQFGYISPGALGFSGENYELFARSLLIPGMQIPFNLRVYNDFGFEQETAFNITIGSVNQNTPLGPDAYGYFIYDETDTAYSDCPVYDWIEINPSQGGSGTRLTQLNDSGTSGDEGDQNGSTALQVVDLPFPFTFYGVPYTQITVSTNGFITMGVTENAEFRNSRLPGGLGPSPMIAAFWDDLIQIYDGGVYQYYDALNHTFIIEYYKMRNGYDRTSLESFQVIFYDPVFHPTSLGDGKIKIQYKDFNNVDVGGGGYTPRHGNYATVGIKDHTNTRGLEYTFNNIYPPAAAPLSSGKALMINTVPVLHESPYLIVQDMIITDANLNGILEPGETAELGIRLINQGLNNATEVAIQVEMSNPYAQLVNPESTYPNIPGDSGAVNTYPILINVSPDCPHGTVLSLLVHVQSGTASWSYPLSLQVQKPSIHIGDYYLNDSAGNANGLADPGETIDLVVNFVNASPLDANYITSSIFCVSEYVNIPNPEVLLPKLRSGATTQAVYQITISDSAPVGMNLTFFITYLGEQINPQNEQLLISLGTTGMNEDFEADNGGFVPNPDFNAWQWGISPYAGAHSGTKVWGTRLTEEYPNGANFLLTTPAVWVSGSFMLEFWHRYSTENNWDGGQVLISTNDGQTWTLLVPENGYPHSSVDALGGPGYTGNSGAWVPARFPLANYANQMVRFRFRFASDSAYTGEGWFIDDVRTTGYIKSVGKVSGSVLSSNASIDYTEVQVSSLSGISCFPDNQGAYALYLPQGTHQVYAECDGYFALSPVSITFNEDLLPLEQDYYLGYLAPVQDIARTVWDGVVDITWSAPLDPEYTLLGYEVYRRVGAGVFELAATVQTTQFSDALPLIGQYQYYVKSKYAEGRSRPSDYLNVNWSGVSNPDTPPQLMTALQANYPNPFNPSTTIAFSLAEASPVKLSIYNLKGQKVKSLHHGALSAGSHTITWQGDDDAGRKVSSGIYLIRYETPQKAYTRKAMLMK